MDLLREKMRLLPLSGPMDSGGGGGGGAPAQSQTTTTELPEWARPYAKDVLAKGQALTDISQNPYQVYNQPRIAGFSPLQQQAQAGAGALGPTQQTAQASDIASAAGLGALGTQYQAGRFSGGTFSPFAAQAYMNPYVEASLAPQLEMLQRQQGQQAAQMASQATQAGAFGGSRYGLAQAQQNLNNQLAQQNLVGQGYNTAYQQAQQQFNADMARRLQAQQLGEQSRQFGANLGLQGLQTGLQAAGQLGNLGQQQFAQQQGAIQQQAALGAQQQALRQQGLDVAYQDFLNQQNYPYKQLGFMSDLIRGLPLGQQSTAQIYQGPGNMLGQAAGLGMLGYGLSKMAADGGLMESYADGGSVADKFANPEAMLPDMGKLTDQQLQGILRSPVTRAEAEAAREELAQRASERGGLSGAFNQIPAAQQDNIIRAAGGGILAFAKGGDEGEYKPTSSYWEQMGNVLGLIPTGLKHLVSAPGYGFSDSESPSKDKSISAYARGQDSTDAEAGIPLSTSPAKTSSAKTGAKTPGVTTSPAGVAAAAQAEPTFEDDLRAAQKFFANPQAQADRQAMNDLIAQMGGRADQLKSQAMNDFLVNYGGALAQGAAQPGVGGGLSGFLRSAAGAAPAGAKSLMDTRKAVAQAQDLNLKMQLEQRRYNIAEDKNDRAAMVSAAQNMRMMRQQQAQLNETIRHNKESERIAASRAASGSGLQKAYMSGMSRAQDRASREATKLWSDPLERSRLEKAGIKSYDQLLQQRVQQHMKYAVPIYGVTAAGEDDED